jgi:Tfp pilus assembly protein PilF
MTSRILTGTAIIVALVGLVTACSDDAKGDSKDEPSASSSASAAAADDSLEGKVNSLIQSGISEAQSGDLATARTTFENALVIDPGNKFALFNLGVIEQTNNKVQSAIKYYDQALASDPEYTPALYNKAILLEPDDLEAAVAIYEKILTIDPEASTTYLRLSFAYDTLGDPAKAEAMRQKAVELDPSLASVTEAPAQ